MKLDLYPTQIEVITSEQMLDAYSSIGMPLMYRHWSFGKRLLQDETLYRRGARGLAYEIVINSNPCICYIMEENTMTMQTLVIAHAAFGHNHFFKNNHLFRQWTDASGIIDYLAFARQYLSQCEERYGVEAVEAVLDACHALQAYGVDRYTHPAPLSAAAEQRRQQERWQQVEREVNVLWSTLPKRTAVSEPTTDNRFEPQENILYVIEKQAPELPQWKREIIRIVRKIAHAVVKNAPETNAVTAAGPNATIRRESAHHDEPLN